MLGNYRGDLCLHIFYASHLSDSTSGNPGFIRHLSFSKFLASGFAPLFGFKRAIYTVNKTETAGCQNWNQNSTVCVVLSQNFTFKLAGIWARAKSLKTRNNKMKRIYKRDCNNQNTESGKVESFKVQPKTSFNGPFPYFRKPTEIGAFSQNDVREFRHDRSQLRFLHLPNVSDVSFDIWAGYKSYIQRDETQNEYIDNLLRWVSENRNKFTVSSMPSDKNRYLPYFCYM